MESVFEAFISNPALYSAGHLVGETLHFPTNTEEVQSLLKRIGVDGVRCQEYFIISFDSDILGLYDYLGEYENIDELNHLAHLLKELSPSERETLEAVMHSGQHCGSVQDLINLTQNLDCYDFHPGVDNEDMLGRLYVEDMESLEVPDNMGGGWGGAGGRAGENPTLTLKHTGGTFPSTKTDTLHRAAM